MAAERHREDIARRMNRQVMILVPKVLDDGQVVKEKVNAFFYIREKKAAPAPKTAPAAKGTDGAAETGTPLVLRAAPAGAYKSLDQVVADPDALEQIIERFRRDLRRLRDRYKFAAEKFPTFCEEHAELWDALARLG